MRRRNASYGTQHWAPERSVHAIKRKEMFAGAFFMTLVHRTFGFAAALGTSALAFALTLA